MQEKSSLKFADRLRSALADRGLRASGLSKKASISKGYVSQLLKGEKPNPSFETVKKFADVLQCSPTWLLYGVQQDQVQEMVLRDDVAIYKTGGKKDAVIEMKMPQAAAPETSIMERLKTLEDDNATMRAQIERLTEMIQGKETR